MKRLFIIIGFVLLISCGAEKDQSSDSIFNHTAAPDTLSSGLELRLLEEARGISTVGIMIHNPARVPIQSVRSWIQFDPSSMHIQDLGIVESRFALFAPGERMIDRTEGFVKLGAATKNPITDAEIMFATFTVRTQQSAIPAALSFYDWREEGNGHTAVLSLKEDAVRNTVALPSSLSL